jgi:RNA polymerase sigma factor (sigma-70 family)
VFTKRMNSDERLVALARAGDEQAFERLYARYRTDLLAFCRHLTGQREDAEDAVQYTFYVTYREIVETTRPLDLRPWLFAVARNRCSSLLRRRRAQPTLRALDGREAATEPPPDELERREELRDLIRDLQALPEQQREALLLSEIADLRHAEIARIIGVSPAKVKALVFQARSSLTSTREARDADCEDIRQELATSSGGALRRRRLRRHVRWCAPCRAFEHALGEQRKGIAALVPLVGGSVQAQLGSGLTSLGAAGGTGGASTLAGGLTGALVAAGVDGGLKAAIAIVAVAGAGIAAAGVTHDRPDRPLGQPPPTEVARFTPSEAGSPPSHAVEARPGPRGSAPTGPTAPTDRVERGAGGAERADRPGGRGDVVPAEGVPALVPVHDDGDGSSRDSASPDHITRSPGRGDAPPGPAHGDGGGPPPGQAREESGLPPDQARKENGGPPPGQGRKETGAEPPGLVGNEKGAEPPGQVRKDSSLPPPGQVRREEGVPPSGETTAPEPVPPVEAAPKGNASPGPPSVTGPGNKKPLA